MSELINTRDSRGTIRWKLLTSASALALVSSMSAASAEDTGHPLIWIELGGQMENIGGQGEVFSPAFLANNPNSSVLWNGVTPLQAQQPPKFSFGEDGKISFQPEDSDWIFSAAIRYGRSSTSREVDHQTNRVNKNYYNNILVATTTAANFADTKVYRRESHAILDFSAAKDIGLGLFGRAATSTLSFGVRFAQFTSNATFDIKARPDLVAKYISNPLYGIHLALPYFHTYHSTGEAARNFRGVGPSLSWNGSAPFVGNQQDGELALDWGINAALLFGKQKTRVKHHESGNYTTKFSKYYHQAYTPGSGGHSSNRSVTVPNVGGSVGFSWRAQDFKVSLGYRADFFFGAMDAGVDARKSETMGFKGPFASISVGLGD